MPRFLYDTAVFAYALGREHPYREPCRAIVVSAGAGALRGEVSADLIQELLHQRLRSTGDRATAVDQVRQVRALVHVCDVTAADAELAVDLFRGSRRLSARDTVFAAVAQTRDIPYLLSPDKDFDELEFPERIDPADATAVRALMRTDT